MSSSSGGGGSKTILYFMIVFMTGIRFLSPSSIDSTSSTNSLMNSLTSL